MAEMRNRPCPTCRAVNAPRAVNDGVEEYRCRGCGLVYYGPCGCDTAPGDSAGLAGTVAAAAAPVAVLRGDWQMTTPPTDTNRVAAVKKYPGC